MYKFLRNLKIQLVKNYNNNSRQYFEKIPEIYSIIQLFSYFSYSVSPLVGQWMEGLKEGDTIDLRWYHCHCSRHRRRHNHRHYCHRQQLRQPSLLSQFIILLLFLLSITRNNLIIITITLLNSSSVTSDNHATRERN